jgi:hypothetical protein
MNKILFPKIIWFLVLLIPFTFFGFYASYFSKIRSGFSVVFHAHAFFMILWVAMAIIQPVLIKQKKIYLHKIIGKISYFIMPFVFITGYLVIQYTYYNFIGTQTAQVEKGILKLTEEEIKANGAAYIMIGVVYFIWLLMFYLLAIINRKKMLPHATYMFAAILTILGPTVDRIIYQITTFFGGTFNVFVENAVFTVIISILLLLIIYQRGKETSVNPSVTALSIYVIGIISYHLLPQMTFWKSFIELVL